MRVPEDRAHLPGREVQHLPATLGVEEAAFGARDDLAGEPAAVADQMPIDVGPEVGSHGARRYNHRGAGRGLPAAQNRLVLSGRLPALAFEWQADFEDRPSNVSTWDRRRRRCFL